MQKEDLSFFQNLIKSSPEWESEECYDDNLEGYLERNKQYNGEWFVWTVDNKKIGISYSVEQAPSNQRPWIGTILVDPLCRQKGYGKLIIECLVSEFQEKKHKVVYAAVPINKNHWISFLSSMGFEQYKVEDVENKTYLIFVKPLNMKL